MADLGIASLNLAHQAGGEVNHGNLVGLVGSYTTTDGKTHELADVWFSKAGSGNSDAGSSAAAGASSSSSGSDAHAHATAGDAKLGLHDVLAGPSADLMGGTGGSGASHAATATSTALHPVDHHVASTALSPLHNLLDEQHKHGPLI
jgi:hypothetical protein